MYKVIVYMNIPIIGKVITIWDEVFCKLIVSFGVLVTRKKVFSDSSHRIETHLGVVVEVLEVQSSLSFEFCLDEEFIEFCCAKIMFQNPHATNFCIMSTVQWWSPPISRYHSCKILRPW